jgi:hypothetical protein
MGKMTLAGTCPGEETAYMKSEAHYEVQKEPQDRPPYRVRVFDDRQRLIAFRRFWTRNEAEDWGRRWVPGPAALPSV